MITKLILEIMCSYITTLIITKGSITHPFRLWFKSTMPDWFQVEGYPHFIECRLCVGFWISLAISLICGTINMFFIVYGFSYFLATQER